MEPRPAKPCAAYGCPAVINRSLLMCPSHWRMLPPELRDEVYSTLDRWRCGESARGYIQAVARAQLAIAKLENREPKVIAAFEHDAGLAQKGSD